MGKTIAIQTLVSWLIDALQNPQKRVESIKNFQNAVWDTGQLSPDNKEADEILNDLAYDLDYYEPDAKKRQEAFSYYGDERAESVIREALKRLASIGVSIPFVKEK